MVIPKDLRDVLDIGPGDEVDMWLDDDHVAVRRADLRRSLRGRFAGDPLLDDLMAARGKDRRREDAR